MVIELFLFSYYVVPTAKQKAKTIIYNISIVEPAINITSETFISMIPDVVMRIDKKIGKNQNILKGVFISQYKRSSREENTILDKEGKLIPSKNVRYLEIHLFDGVLYSENKFKNYYQIIEFKTLIEHLDISKLTNKNFEDNYSTLNTQKFLERIKVIKRNNQKFYQELLKEDPPIRGNLFKDLESPPPQKKSVDYQSLNTKEKKQILYKTQRQLHEFSINILNHKEQIKEHSQYLSKYEIELHRKFSFSISCILMFFIGSPLGAIIRKGGMGLPTLVSLIVFIVYFTLLTVGQNLSEKGYLSNWLGVWIANLFILQ